MRLNDVSPFFKRREGVFNLFYYEHVKSCPVFFSNSLGVLYLSTVNRKRLLAHLSLLKLKNEVVRRNHSACSVNIFEENSESSLCDPVSEGGHIGNNKFLEWFCGFTDGEGGFFISKITSQGRSAYSFNFRITLHIDDSLCLCNIRDTLGFGKVYEYKEKNNSSFSVSKKEDIKKLITIFDSYPLQSTKLLNFLDFRKAFYIYNSSSNRTREVMDEIAKISLGMNRNRIDFKFPPFRAPQGLQIQITRYWLLGFTEAEGSFGVKQDKQAYKGNLAFRYVLSQSDLDLALLEAIKVFLVNIPEAKQSGLMLDKSIYINVSEKRQNHHKNEATLTVTQMELLKCVLVPLFDSMNWFTQKQLDYSLWKSLILLKEKGHHYTEEGFKFIQLIINQMNKHRLSSSGSSVVERESLNSKIQDMLGKSVYENKNGRVWISSENRYLNEGGIGKEVNMVDTKGNTIKTFKSYSEAARYLKISRGTVFNRIKSSQVFSFKEKDVYLKA